MKIWPIVTILLWVSANTSAATITRYGNVNAVGACQAPTPAYDKYLVKRPMAIANRGTTGAFLACSVQNHAFLGTRLIRATFYNANSAAVMVNCTLVEGAHSSGGLDWFYVGKSLMIQPNGTSNIDWNASVDNGGTNFFRVNFTCLLPPGVEIGEISNVWDEDVGS